MSAPDLASIRTEYALKTLEEASRIELGFAMDMYAKDFVRAIAYVGLRDKIIV